MMKKLLFLCLSVLILFGTAACSGSSGGSSNKDEQYKATKAGFGGDIEVEMTIKDGAVKRITVTGDSETEGIGSKAIEAIQLALDKLIGESIDDLDAGSIEVVSSATVTSTAIKAAVSDVFNQARGIDPNEKKAITDSEGVYKAAGMSVVKPLSIKVTLKDNKISAIEVADHAESDEVTGQSGATNIADTAFDNLIPRIIENQSLAVEAISGATVTSNGIKAAVAQAIDRNGGDSSQWYTPVEKKTDVVKLEGYDVIVVGLGGSGSMAYVSAAEKGATVFGIETAAKIGGQSATVSGAMAINPESKVQSQNNGAKFVEEEELLEDWIAYTQGDAKEEIVRNFVYESGETMDWLMDKYRFEFLEIKPFFHPKMWPVWAYYAGNKTDYFTNAVNKAKSYNDKNDYMLELTAEELITEGDKVTGVRAKFYDGTVYEVYGDSVIIGTGGFIGNSEMKKKFLGENDDYNTIAWTVDDGDGINMAMDIGADAYNIDMDAMVHIAQTKTIIKGDELTADQKAVLSSLVLTGESMIVGTDGARYMNEAGNIAFDSYKGGDTYYAIYNDTQLNSFKEIGMKSPTAPMFLNQGGKLPEANTPIADLDKILTVGSDYGIVVTADTLDELAEKLGIDGANLKKAVADYNSYAAGTAQDPFGKDPAMMTALEQGPYTAVLGAPYAYATAAGLNIDENYNVLKTDGSVMENVYAVGQDSMGVLFSNKVPYVSYGGAAQGWAITSGRLAGQQAAEMYKD
ncbi:FAD-binding protein [Bacillus tuaregi]|uniref:FAD-binding protein n=1 Tax=Bacillus tuaregi TaxID=1816695 RepID=UPI000A016C7B|nr:FAD-binding protein [Bacillus tuaregi]